MRKLIVACTVLGSLMASAGTNWVEKPTAKTWEDRLPPISVTYKCGNLPNGDVVEKNIDMDAMIREQSLAIIKTLFFKPTDAMLDIEELTWTFEDYPGLSEKGGGDANPAIRYSYQASQDALKRGVPYLTDEIRGVLTHELTHAYNLSPIGCGTYGSNKMHWAYIEGLADAVRAKLCGFAGDDPTRPREGSSYLDGYRMTGYFFLWLEETVDPDFLRKLTATTKTVQPWTFDGAFISIFGEGKTAQYMWDQYVAACKADGKKFNWRGVMLDVSRHFFTPEAVCRLIDRMAELKLNRLHLHLTDNEGFRLQIKAYPNLTPPGSQFYTQQEMRDMVSYAGSKGIQIIPEIDVPGHAVALTGGIPELTCNGNRGVICIGNPKTIPILRNILTEVVDIFPSPWIHLGGDEADTSSWKTCQYCSKDPNQSTFTKEVSDLTKSFKKVMLGWDEIDSDGNVAPKGSVIFCWRDEGFTAARQAIKRGHRVVLCPQRPCYFDWGYSINSSKALLDWEIPADIADKLYGVQVCLWTERVPDEATMNLRFFPRIAAFAEMANHYGNVDKVAYAKKLVELKKHWKALGMVIEEEDNSGKPFDPSKDKPVLTRNAVITTTFPGSHLYKPEFAFDGRNNSYFWSSGGYDKGATFTVTLGEPTKVNSIKVLTGDSKDQIKAADLEVSVDGKTFETLAKFDAQGTASVEGLNGRVIRVVRIRATAPSWEWAVIREIIIK